MDMKVTGESELITLADLAGRIGTGKVDIHSNEWGQSDAEQRRKIAESFTPDIVLASLLEMAAQGRTIHPLSPASGEPLGAPPDENWLLTREDADTAVQCLRVAINRRAILLTQEKEKLDAGRYTIEEAATELAANTGLDVDRWRKTLLAEVKEGRLSLRNPRDFGDLLPYAVPNHYGPGAARDFLLMCEQVTASDLNNCLESHPEWRVTYRLGMTSQPRAAAETRVPVSVQTASDGSRSMQREESDILADLESDLVDSHIAHRAAIGLVDDDDDEPGSLDDYGDDPFIGGLDSPADPTAPIARQRWQENEILRILKLLGYSPLALPKADAGKKGVKFEARTRCVADNSSKWSGSSVFDKAWNRLSEQARIKYSE